MRAIGTRRKSAVHFRRMRAREPGEMAVRRCSGNLPVLFCIAVVAARVWHLGNQTKVEKYMRRAVGFFPIVRPRDRLDHCRLLGSGAWSHAVMDALAMAVSCVAIHVEGRVKTRRKILLSRWLPHVVVWY